MEVVVEPGSTLTNRDIVDNFNNLPIVIVITYKSLGITVKVPLSKAIPGYWPGGWTVTFATEEQFAESIKLYSQITIK
jgi:hypothetical protein